MAALRDDSRLLQRPSNIRNICILAHVDHGKTCLSDCLLSFNGVISEAAAGKVRYLDSREDEQHRQITIKASVVSLFYRRNPQVPESTAGRNTVSAGASSWDPTCQAGSALPKDDSTKEDAFIVNLVDCPGHVDFSSEVSSAVRLCDGCLLLVDAVEGVESQTFAALQQAWTERVVPVLVLSKMDKLIQKLHMSPSEAYVHCAAIIEQVNAYLHQQILSEILVAEDAAATGATEPATAAKEVFKKNGESSGNWVYFDDHVEEKLEFNPAKGNVLFLSSLHGWCLHIPSFARQTLMPFLSLPKEALPRLVKVLWGDFYFRKKNSATSTALNSIKTSTVRFSNKAASTSASNKNTTTTTTTSVKTSNAKNNTSTTTTSTINTSHFSKTTSPHNTTTPTNTSAHNKTTIISTIDAYNNKTSTSRFFERPGSPNATTDRKNGSSCCNSDLHSFMKNSNWINKSSTSTPTSQSQCIDGDTKDPNNEKRSINCEQRCSSCTELNCSKNSSSEKTSTSNNWSFCGCSGSSGEVLETSRHRFCGNVDSSDVTEQPGSVAANQHSACFSAAPSFEKKMKEAVTTSTFTAAGEAGSVVAASSVASSQPPKLQKNAVSCEVPSSQSIWTKKVETAAASATATTTQGADASSCQSTFQVRRTPAFPHQLRLVEQLIFSAIWRVYAVAAASPVDAERKNSQQSLKEMEKQPKQQSLKGSSSNNCTKAQQLFRMIDSLNLREGDKVKGAIDSLVKQQQRLHLQSEALESDMYRNHLGGGEDDRGLSHQLDQKNTHSNFTTDDDSICSTSARTNCEKMRKGDAELEDEIIKTVFSRWLPVAQTLLEVIVQRIPNPLSAAEQRLPHLCPLLPSDVVAASLVQQHKELGNALCKTPQHFNLANGWSRRPPLTLLYVAKFLAADSKNKRLTGDRLQGNERFSGFVGLCRVFVGCLRKDSILYICEEKPFSMVSTSQFCNDLLPIGDISSSKNMLHDSDSSSSTRRSCHNSCAVFDENSISEEGLSQSALKRNFVSSSASIGSIGVDSISTLQSTSVHNKKHAMREFATTTATTISTESEYSLPDEKGSFSPSRKNPQLLIASTPPFPAHSHTTQMAPAITVPHSTYHTICDDPTTTDTNSTTTDTNFTTTDTKSTTTDTNSTTTDTKSTITDTKSTATDTNLTTTDTNLTTTDTNSTTTDTKSTTTDTNLTTTDTNLTTTHTNLTSTDTNLTTTDTNLTTTDTNSTITANTQSSATTTNLTVCTYSITTQSSANTNNSTVCTHPTTTDIATNNPTMCSHPTTTDNATNNLTVCKNSFVVDNSDKRDSTNDLNSAESNTATTEPTINKYVSTSSSRVDSNSSSVSKSRCVGRRAQRMLKVHAIYLLFGEDLLPIESAAAGSVVAVSLRPYREKSRNSKRTTSKVTKSATCPVEKGAETAVHARDSAPQSTDTAVTADEEMAAKGDETAETAAETTVATRQADRRRAPAEEEKVRLREVWERETGSLLTEVEQRKVVVQLKDKSLRTLSAADGKSCVFFSENGRSVSNHSAEESTESEAETEEADVLGGETLREVTASLQSLRDRNNRLLLLLQHRETATTAKSLYFTSVQRRLTLSNWSDCPAFLDPRSKASAAIVRVAVEPQRLEDAQQFVTGMARLYMADPSIEISVLDSGEFLLGCCGEVHLETSLRDLQTLYAQIPITVSAPTVAIRETLAGLSSGVLPVRRAGAFFGEDTKAPITSSGYSLSLLTGGGGVIDDAAAASAAAASQNPKFFTPSSVACCSSSLLSAAAMESARASQTAVFSTVGKKGFVVDSSCSSRRKKRVCNFTKKTASSTTACSAVSNAKKTAGKAGLTNAACLITSPGSTSAGGGGGGGILTTTTSTIAPLFPPWARRRAPVFFVNSVRDDEEDAESTTLATAHAFSGSSFSSKNRGEEETWLFGGDVAGSAAADACWSFQQPQSPLLPSSSSSNCSSGTSGGHSMCDDHKKWRNCRYSALDGGCYSTTNNSDNNGPPNTPTLITKSRCAYCCAGKASEEEQCSNCMLLGGIRLTTEEEKEMKKKNEELPQDFFVRNASSGIGPGALITEKAVVSSADKPSAEVVAVEEEASLRKLREKVRSGGGNGGLAATSTGGRTNTQGFRDLLEDFAKKTTRKYVEATTSVVVLDLAVAGCTPSQQLGIVLRAEPMPSSVTDWLTENATEITSVLKKGVLPSHPHFLKHKRASHSKNFVDSLSRISASQKEAFLAAEEPSNVTSLFEKKSSAAVSAPQPPLLARSTTWGTTTTITTATTGAGAAAGSASSTGKSAVFLPMTAAAAAAHVVGSEHKTDVFLGDFFLPSTPRDSEKKKGGAACLLVDAVDCLGQELLFHWQQLVQPKTAEKASPATSAGADTKNQHAEKAAESTAVEAPFFNEIGTLWGLTLTGGACTALFASPTCALVAVPKKNQCAAATPRNNKNSSFLRAAEADKKMPQQQQQTSCWVAVETCLGGSEDVQGEEVVIRQPTESALTNCGGVMTQAGDNSLAFEITGLLHQWQLRHSCGADVFKPVLRGPWSVAETVTPPTTTPTTVTTTNSSAGTRHSVAYSTASTNETHTEDAAAARTATTGAFLGSSAVPHAHTNTVLDDAASTTTTITTAGISTSTFAKGSNAAYAAATAIMSRAIPSLVAGFELASLAGPLAEEPVRGVAFFIEALFFQLPSSNSNNHSTSCNICRYNCCSAENEEAAKSFSSNSSLPPHQPQLTPEGLPSGQVISMMKDTCRRVLLQRGRCRIYEGMMRFTLTCEQRVLGKVYGVLSRRRSRIVKEGLFEGQTSLFIISGFLPTGEAVGIAQELRSKASGLASLETLFSHWEVLNEDPFPEACMTAEELEEEGEAGFAALINQSVSRKIIYSIRKTKGLPTGEKLIAAAEKQRTLSKNK